MLANLQTLEIFSQNFLFKAKIKQSTKFYILENKEPYGILEIPSDSWMKCRCLMTKYLMYYADVYRYFAWHVKVSPSQKVAIASHLTF